MAIKAAAPSRATKHCAFFPQTASAHPVQLEPFQSALEAVNGLRLAVAGPVVGMEGVGRVGVDDELAFSGRGAAAGQGGFHAFDGVQWDAGVALAVQAEHRAGQPGGHVDRVRGGSAC